MKKVLLIVCVWVATILVGCQAQTITTETKEQNVQPFDEEVFSIVEGPYKQDVARSFAPGAKQIVLDRDLHVYRYWGGGSGESGFYYSKKMYTDRDEAIRDLALPERNTASNVTQYKIPQGTTVIYGNAANMVGVEGYGMYATGGAEQYFMPNPSLAEKELEGKLEYTKVIKTVDELEEVESVIAN